MATFEKLDGSKVKLTIQVKADVFEDAMQKAYIKARGKFNVPGFRKGKAPRKVIESMYGELAFFDDAFDIVYPAAYEAALTEHDVKPVDHPSINIVECEKGKDMVFEAEVEVRPEVVLGEYKGIEVEKREYNVTDAMVDAEIDKEREAIARYVDVSRPVEDGDTVNLDYSGSVDGVKFDGGTAEDQKLVIGSHSFIPGFEEGMVGINIGEEKDITVTFPEEYHAENLAGKEAVFHVKVNSIQKKELPAADDDFAKDVSEFDTIADFRADKKRILSEKLEQEAKTQIEDEAIRKAAANAKIDLPTAMVEHQIDQMVQDIDYRLSMQGLNFADYCKYTGTNENMAREEMRGEATERVRMQLVMEAIAKAEDVKAEPDEIEAKIEEYAKRFGERAEEFKKNISDNDKLYFADQIVVGKVLDFIVANAKLVEKKEEEKKPKKTAKKAEAEGAAEEKPKKAAKKPAEKTE